MTLSNLVGTYRPGRKEISQNADKAFDGKIYRGDNWTVDFTQTEDLLHFNQGGERKVSQCIVD